MSETTDGTQEAPVATADAPAETPVAESAPQAVQNTDGQDAPSLYDDVEVPEQAGPADEPGEANGDTQEPADGGEQPSQDGEADPYVDVTLPEGAVLPQEALDGLKEFGTKYGLSADAVREMAEQNEARIHQIEAERLAEVNRWRDELAADPDLGGENLKQTGLLAAKALHGHPEVQQLLEETGMKYSLPVARFLAAVGTNSSEPLQVVKDGVPASDGLTTRDIWPNSPDAFHRDGRS